MSLQARTPLWLLLVSCACSAPARGDDAAGAKPRERPSNAEARPCQVGYRRVEFRFTTSAGEERKRQLDLWYPTQEREAKHAYKGQVGFAAEGAAVAPGKHPLVLFSHGYLGSSDQTIFVTEGCARAGYVVASMNHADSMAVRQAQKDEPPRFADVDAWSDQKFRARRDDLAALLDRLLEWNGTADSPWKGRIDAERIGGMGHSLGGYTVLGMAGGWKSWTDPRLKAAVLFSPYTMPFPAKGNLGQIAIPVMMQGGTLDFGITPLLPSVYEKLSGPRTLLVLKNETHFGWTNLVSLGKSTTEAVAAGNPELVLQYAAAFFDQHLLGLDRSDLLERKNARLDSYRFDPQGR